MEKLRDFAYGLRTVVVILFRWAKAKIKGEPYDSGMDM